MTIDSNGDDDKRCIVDEIERHLPVAGCTGDLHVQEILDGEQRFTGLCDDPNPSAPLRIFVAIADLLLMLLHLRSGRWNSVTSFLREFPSNAIQCLFIARMRHLYFDDS